MSRILIVEEDLLLQTQLEVALEDSGHQVSGFASSSESAVAEARAVQPDLALVDLNLADGPTGLWVGNQMTRDGVPVLYLARSTACIPQEFSGVVGIVGRPQTRAAVQTVLASIHCWQGSALASMIPGPGFWLAATPVARCANDNDGCNTPRRQDSGFVQLYPQDHSPGPLEG